MNNAEQVGYFIEYLISQHPPREEYADSLVGEMLKNLQPDAGINGRRQKVDGFY